MGDNEVTGLWLVVAAGLFPLCAYAQLLPPPGAGDYPAKPVRVIVGVVPGGATDIQARLLSRKVSENLARAFVVENRPGAGGTVAFALVAKSPPDGYTLLATASGYTITPAVYGNLPYDPIKDFAPISLVLQAPLLLLAHPSLPVKSTKDLIALAKARPGALNAASAGIGTSSHLSLELFKYLAQLNVVHVPYKGAGQALVDVVAGQADVIFASVLSASSSVKSRRLRALGVTTAKRSMAMPDIPSIAEGGVEGYELSSWFGWLAPAGTPAAIVNKLSVELAKAIKSSEIAEKLAGDGGEPVGSTPEQFEKFIAIEVPRWHKVVKASGLRLE